MYLNTTTTTTSVVTDIDGSTETVLLWPSSLSANDKHLIWRQLQTVPCQFHQAILDSLNVKLTAIASGASKPFTSNIQAYTRKLGELAVTGQLNHVRTLAPAKADDHITMPESHGAIERELRELEVQLSNLSSEVKHLKQLGKIGRYVPEALVSTEEQWKSASQRYAQLKQMLVSE